MDNSMLSDFSGTIFHIRLLILFISVVLHIIFATGVAKDVGNLHKSNTPTQIIPGFAWVLAVLIGGIVSLVVYWAMHHSSLARSWKN